MIFFFEQWQSLTEPDLAAFFAVGRKQAVFYFVILPVATCQYANSQYQSYLAWPWPLNDHGSRICMYLYIYINRHKYVYIYIYIYIYTYRYRYMETKFFCVLELAVRYIRICLYRYIYTYIPYIYLCMSLYRYIKIEY
jgi:hypothetical protein